MGRRRTLVPQAARPNTKYRAGTQLSRNPDHLRPITGTGFGRGVKIHGMVDLAQSVYQTGGEAGNFIFWKDRVVSLSMDAWLQIAGIVKTLEFVDHTKNVCYRTTIEKATKQGNPYDNVIGERWGIPLDCFEQVDAYGTVIKRAEQ